MEGSGLSLTEVLTPHLPRGTEENERTQDIRFPDRDSSREHSKLLYTASPLHKPARFLSTADMTTQGRVVRNVPTLCHCMSHIQISALLKNVCTNKRELVFIGINISM
jgi:hypothetical protein